MKTTIETITNEQIEALYTCAGKAGDGIMAAICKRALGLLDIPLAPQWTRMLTPREQARVTAMSGLQARLECVSAMGAAEMLAEIEKVTG